MYKKNSHTKVSNIKKFMWIEEFLRNKLISSVLGSIKFEWIVEDQLKFYHTRDLFKVDIVKYKMMIRGVW